MNMNNTSDKKTTTPSVTKVELQSIFQNCADFMLREIYVGEQKEWSVWLCWIDGLASGTDISDTILRPLTDPLRFEHCTDYAHVYREIYKGAVHNFTAKSITNSYALAEELLNGSCGIIFPNLRKAISFEVRSTFMRSVDTSTQEKSVKGSKEAFIENIRVNTALIRRKLKTPKLKTLTQTVGEKSDTYVTILYIEGAARNDTVKQLQIRLSNLDIDGLLVPGYLEQYIVDAPRSPFPQLLHTERPDTFASMLLDGRIGILVDGLPVGFVVPATLSRFMQVTEDTAQHFAVASMLVLLRYLALLAGLLLPGLYVAIAMYHQEMIPTELLTSVIDAKQKVPFSTAMEVIGMLVAFELLQEAGLRLPSPVGDTVSIIGALIVGQAAVDARVVSPIAVIIVAFSGISSYTLPSQDFASAIRILRFSVVISAALAGIFGVTTLFMLLIWHLCTIESCGIAYMHPFVDGSGDARLRSILRSPLWKDLYRDKKIAGFDLRKQK